MKTLGKALVALLRLLLLTAAFIVGFLARALWKIAGLACAYLAVRAVARREIRKALS